MNIKFDTYPLSIYRNPESISLLESINRQVPIYKLSSVNIAQSILSSFVSNLSGSALLSLVDKASIGVKGQKARKCLSNLIREQSTKVSRNPFTIIDEAQKNLMITSCITDNLTSLECSSWENGAKSIAKSVIGLLSFKNPLDTMFESVKEITLKYEDICQIYYIAFLLNVYNENPTTEITVKKLIVESLCDDSDGKSSFSTKKRDILFADTSYKTLNDNLRYRLSTLDYEIMRDKDLYPFIEWQRKLNED